MAAKWQTIFSKEDPAFTNEWAVQKIIMAVLSLPAAFLLTVISTTITANYRVRTVGEWAAYYIVPRLGGHHQAYDVGPVVEVSFFGDIFFWLVLLWSVYLVISKLRHRGGEEQ
jgi:hypothetical protein